ncbi:hypothetical protein HCH_01682 [Hahella chejuensis KCTC 2396]|uniref:Uncharacterized protein n=1 Tax=Hahella chejuensis (strain KCTC 2396) TaxID=349521 RepID=Q2SLE1_HAHCH|nr:hypothetical protein HCH_01682 [Hahella chejuensis KCTC 2396]
MARREKESFSLFYAIPASQLDYVYMTVYMNG